MEAVSFPSYTGFMSLYVLHYMSVSHGVYRFRVSSNEFASKTLDVSFCPVFKRTQDSVFPFPETILTHYLPKFCYALLSLC